MDHDEVFEDTWLNKKDGWIGYVKMMFYVQLEDTLDVVKGRKRSLDLKWETV